MLLLAFFIVQQKMEKETTPFFARIITPAELQKDMILKTTPQVPDKSKKDRILKVPKLPKDTPPPKEISAVPQQRDPEQKTLKPSAESGFPGKIDDKPTDSATKDIGVRDKGIEREREGVTEKPLAKTFREKFFDRDIIGKFAKKDKEVAKPDSGITFDTKEFKYYGYLQRLKEKIEGIWRYPSDAAEKRLYGDLYIRFTIMKDGRLGAVELVRTSGYKSLDDAAIKALKEAEPYWPLPDEWEENRFTITGHFVYSLYGAYIR